MTDTQLSHLTRIPVMEQVLILGQKVWGCRSLVIGPHDRVDRRIGSKGGSKLCQGVRMDADVRIDKHHVWTARVHHPIVPCPCWSSWPVEAHVPEAIGPDQRLDGLR